MEKCDHPVRENLLEVRDLAKHYHTANGVKTVLDGLNFSVRRQEIVCIVGPSGTGKTTLLRCLAGLHAPTSGSVLISGRTFDQPPAELAVVFQDYSRSLMPWLTVLGNVALPLRATGLSRRDAEEQARSAIHEVGLKDCHSAYPWQLSGGMQQRVAIARALAYRPKAIIMDEPFASVDAQTRADLEDLVLQLKETSGVTIILVTHDIDEAVYMADRVVVLSGSPAKVEKVIEVNLGNSRDQIATKALPEFAALRSDVYRLIRS
jgi:NitT/TauT family transport system ATP-binding protein